VYRGCNIASGFFISMEGWFVDLRLSELSLEFELQERLLDAERLHIQTEVPLSGRIATAATAGLGHMLVRAGTRLETVANQHAAKRSLALVNPDPCGGWAN
jgi:hypothetical protein